MKRWLLDLRTGWRYRQLAWLSVISVSAWCSMVVAQPTDTCEVAPDQLSCAGDCGIPGDHCYPQEILADANGNFLEVSCCACDPDDCHLILDPATLAFSCTPDPACPVPPGGECRLIGHGNLDGTISYSCDCVNTVDPNECVYVEECNADCPGTCVKRCTGVCPDPDQDCVPTVIAETFPGARDYYATECSCDDPTLSPCRPVATADGVTCSGLCPNGVDKCDLVISLGEDGVSQEYRCEPCTGEPEIGACCVVDEMGTTGCVEIAMDDCLSSPANVWYGTGTTCLSHGAQCGNPFPQEGACCYFDPPTGVSICTLTTQQECENNLGGTYQGNATNCTPDPCINTSGACCYIDANGNPQCTQTDGITCELEYMGIYQGDGVDCSVNVCPIEESCECPGNCDDRTPAYTDQAYASFTDEVAVATENSQFMTNPAVVMIDIKNRNLAPINLNWTPRTNSRYSHPSWTMANLGGVFGVALDVRGHAYVTKSTCYNVDVLGGIGGTTWGTVFKLDASTGAISIFANLPNTGPGLGNICYDGTYDQFFVSNLEDGRIYRLDSTGACLGTFDHATGTILDSCRSASAFGV